MSWASGITAADSIRHDAASLPAKVGASEDRESERAPSVMSSDMCTSTSMSQGGVRRLVATDIAETATWTLLCVSLMLSETPVLVMLLPLSCCRGRGSGSRVLAAQTTLGTSRTLWLLLAALELDTAQVLQLSRSLVGWVLVGDAGVVIVMDVILLTLAMLVMSVTLVLKLWAATSTWSLDYSWDALENRGDLDLEMQAVRTIPM